MSETPESGYIVNPSTVGNPNETPIVQLSPELMAYFERTRCPECDLINHCHEDSCSRGGAR
jgi:hypothetical protein